MIVEFPADRIGTVTVEYALAPREPCVKSTRKSVAFAQAPFTPVAWTSVGGGPRGPCRDEVGPREDEAREAEGHVLPVRCGGDDRVRVVEDARRGAVRRLPGGDLEVPEGLRVRERRRVDLVREQRDEGA